MIAAGGAGRAARPLPDDRRGGALRLVPMFVATAASVSLAAGTVPSRLSIPAPGVVVGVVVSGLAIFFLRSVPARWAARGVIIIGAILVVRYGSFISSAGESASTDAWAWGIATSAALVLSSRLEDDALPRLAPASSGAGAGATARARMVPTARVVVVLAIVIGAVSLALGPRVASTLSSADRRGRPATQPTERDSPLAASMSLDMTTRPHLSSAVVMTVRTDKPSFLRDSTFDRWDGRSWHRSHSELISLGPNGSIAPAADDLAARTGTIVHQQIRIEAASSDLVPAAPSAVSISSRQALVQWPDGNALSVLEPLGRGATYDVTSRVLPVTPAALEAARLQPIPEDVTKAYAQPPVTTDRVRALAKRITADSGSNYDKVLAIERWLGAHTSYSINAPLAPVGHDVVDDFIFRSKVGWCEQIASSLVVMLRVAGVPARLATGFVPGDWDPILHDYRVRESDAHAWAEVWFPTLGWVPFDPTASVPLAGAAATPSGGHWWTNSWLLLAGAAVIAISGFAWRGSRRLIRRVAVGSRRPRRSQGWVATAEVRLERLGAAVGAPRRPDETAAAYAHRLATRFHHDGLWTVGALLDEATYGPRSIGDDDPRVGAALVTLDDADLRDRASPEPVGAG